MVLVVAMIAALVNVSPAAAQAGFVSDDFDAASLGSQWALVDPLGDASFSMVGAGSGQAFAQLGVPGGVSHDQWGVSDAPRLMQPITNGDLELEVSFLTTPSAKYQAQGLVVEESATDWVRADLYHDGNNLRLFAGSTNGGSSSARLNKIVSGSTSFVRMTRAGNTWSVATSTNGTSWSSAGSFTEALTASSAGVFVGNAGPSPAYTARFDYVFETASPVSPEDGGATSHAVNVAVVGDGSVTRSPDLAAYPEGSSVTLTASPDAGASFTGWSGDVSSANSSITVTVNAATNITATFTTAPAVYPVNVSVVGDGSVSRSPNQSTYAAGSSVTLTASPDAGASFSGWSGDTSSTNSSVTVTVNAAMNITASFTTAPPPAGFVSDDFDTASLGSEWSITDPRGDASFSMVGEGTGEAYAELAIPGGVSHDQWGVSNAPRLLQSIPDTDLELEVSFLTTPSAKYQAQGLVVEESATDWVRADLYHDGNNLRVFAGSTSGGSSSARLNRVVPAATSFLRLDRAGNTWTVSYSSDGASWSSAGSFSASLAVSTGGVFVGNAGPSPAYTAQFDYVFETGSPVSPEDGVGGASYPVDVVVVGDGTVTRSPDLATYPAGSQVTLTANPDAGASFSGWSGDVSSTNPSITVTVNSATDVTASFTTVPGSYPVDVAVIGDGSVTKSPNQATYTAGSSVTLTATPDAGATFSGWSGDVTSTNTSVTVTVNAATNVTATFTTAPTSYPVNVSVVGNGSVTKSPDQATYTAGSSVTLTATPGGGATFSGWSGDVTSTNTSITVTVNAATNLTATFSAPPAGDFQSDDFNVASLDPVWSLVDPLGDSSFSMVGAGSGQAYAQLGVPGGTAHDQWGVSEAPRLMQSVPDEDFALEASFLTTPSAKYQAHGIVVEESLTDWVRADLYHDGNNLRVFAGATNGGSSASRLNAIVPASTSFLRLDRSGNTWSVSHSSDGSSWTAAGSFSETLAVTSAGVFVGNAGPSPAYTAQFDYVFDTASPILSEDGGAASYPLTVSVVGDGSVSRSPDLAAYPQGSTVTLTASPDAGASFTGWSGDISSTTNPITVTVNAATSVTATFTTAPASYPVNVSIAGDGSVSKAPNQSTYTAGSSVTLTATPDAGQSFIGWSGDVTSTNTSVTVTVNAAVNVTASFTEAPSSDGIEIWYGSSQTFGNNGITQRWVNILGTASDDDGISSLTYTLNGGGAQGLSIGPDLRRLPDPGDFNVEIDRFDLNNGANTVVITMVDGQSNVSTETVTVNWSPTTVGLPLTVDWSAAGDIDDVAEVLDGRWDIVNGEARPTQIEYDRGLLIGDLTWDDFEIEVPVTLNAIGPNSGQPLSGEALVGFALHWQGHADSQGDQPRWRFWPTGAFAWYDTEGSGKTEILGNNNSPASLSTRSLSLGDTYIFKARAEDVPGGTEYSFKVWEQGTAEPAGWDESIVENSGPDTGSVVLLAHHFDVSFGDVVVTAIP